MYVGAHGSCPIRRHGREWRLVCARTMAGRNVCKAKCVCVRTEKAGDNIVGVSKEACCATLCLRMQRREVVSNVKEKLC